jgi:Tfp pilus assembly protein PilX
MQNFKLKPVNIEIKSNKGFTLLVAIITTSLLLIVSFVVSNIALKQVLLSSASQESQYAYFNADSGLECAIHWDLKDPTSTPFNPSASSNITCNSQTMVVGGSNSSTFAFDLTKGCATVIVTKNINNTTTIQSKGYNTCSPGAARKYERGVEITYDNGSVVPTYTNVALNKTVTGTASPVPNSRSC